MEVSVKRLSRSCLIFNLHKQPWMVCVLKLVRKTIILSQLSCLQVMFNHQKSPCPQLVQTVIVPMYYIFVKCQLSLWSQMKCRTACKNTCFCRDIWNRFLEFESNIGDLASIVKVEKRRSGVLSQVSVKPIVSSLMQ